MYAKIYQPKASAMTSGRANLDHWVLEFSSASPSLIDPLTGNRRATDMQSQLDLRFESAESAVAYAKAHNIAHQLIQSGPRKRISRSYSENFNYERKLPWTH